MEKDYWFFMSYAGRDAILGDAQTCVVDSYLKIFFNDLALELASKAGIEGEIKVPEIGFIAERSIKNGDLWPSALVDALQTSRALICIYSRSYFSSEYCGKEFQVFLDRLNEYMKTAPPGTSRPRLILPVLWEHPDTLPKQRPPAISEIQYKHDDFGKAYAENGLNFLMRQRQHKPDYSNFVFKFAKQLFEEAEQKRLPPLRTPPSLTEVKAAFPLPVEQDPPLQPRAGNIGPIPRRTENVGPNVAQFLFVAGRDKEYLDIRKGVECYGQEGGREWKPFYPEIDEAVGMISQAVAVSEKLFYENLTISEGLIEHLSKAEENNKIVIIVIDPWSIQVQNYRNRLLDFDRHNFINCGLLIPWNENDNETKNRGNELRDSIEQTLSRYYVLNTPYIRESVRSPEELQKKLIAAIHELRKRIVQRAKVFRPIENENSTHMPTVTGPGGGSQ
jgi:FxsC-like protein